MNATILLALADSGLHLVGNMAVQADLTSMTLIGEDEDSHVALFEASWGYGDERCYCCCCTGECRDQGPSFEEALAEGFVEGDYPAVEPVPCECSKTLDGWSSLEDCLPSCRHFMGYGIAPRACWFA